MKSLKLILIILLATIVAPARSYAAEDHQLDRAEKVEEAKEMEEEKSEAKRS